MEHSSADVHAERIFTERVLKNKKTIDQYALVVSKLKKSYGHFKAVKNLNFTVNKGIVFYLFYTRFYINCGRRMFRFAWYERCG